MYFKLSLEEAKQFIASKLGFDEKDVTIILPETKSETTNYMHDSYMTNTITTIEGRTQIVHDVKLALSIDKMFAIRVLRYRIRSLSLKDAREFIEMDKVDMSSYISTGRFPDSRIVE